MPYGNHEKPYQETVQPPQELIQDTGTQLKFSPYHLSDKGNVVAFGPVSREYSEIEALLIVVYFAKSMKTNEGQKHLKDIIVAYLNNMGRAIDAMQKASCSHVLTALLNQYACTNIYARIGLITPFDQVQTKLFLDHYFGELLKRDYVLQGLTTYAEMTGQAAAALGGIMGGIVPKP